MKKIMIAVVAVAVAAVAHAASFNWQNAGSRTTGTIYDYTGTAVGTGVAAYIFDAAVLSQADLLTEIRSGSDISTMGALDKQYTSASKIVAGEAFSHGEVGGTYTYYFAILDAANDQLLISDIAIAQGQQGDTALIAFSGSTTWSKVANGEASYSTAGWYSTVPEPTSALLLLLGVAGLALKRKQA